MTEPVMLRLSSQKTNKRQTIAGFGKKILKFSLRIKKSVPMLEKEVLFAKFKTVILNIAKIRKSLVKKLTFKIILKDWKIITVSNIERKYEPFREIKKIKRVPKQVKLYNRITLNSIKLMKIFKTTTLSLTYTGKNRRARSKF